MNAKLIETNLVAAGNAENIQLFAYAIFNILSEMDLQKLEFIDKKNVNLIKGYLKATLKLKHLNAKLTASYESLDMLYIYKTTVGLLSKHEGYVPTSQDVEYYAALRNGYNLNTSLTKVQNRLVELASKTQQKYFKVNMLVLCSNVLLLITTLMLLSMK